MRVETKYQIAIAVIVGLVTLGYLWDRNQTPVSALSPQLGKIQEIVARSGYKDSVLTLNFIAENKNAPVFLDSLSDPEWNLKAIQFVGIDSLKRPVYAIQFLRGE